MDDVRINQPGEARGLDSPPSSSSDRTKGSRKLDGPVSWRALHDSELPEVAFLVDRLIPTETLAVLAGKPKAGKSYFALQLAEAVATGRPFLGRATRCGKILYFVYEDSERRIKRRGLELGFDPEADIEFDFEPRHLDDPQGMTRFENLIAFGSPALAIIDTLRAATSAGFDENKSGPVAAIVQRLQQVARLYGTSILLVHHMRKGGATRALVDEIRGSSALGGAADTLLGLRRVSESKQRVLAELEFVGRDIEEGTETLAFDPETGAWTQNNPVPTEEPGTTLDRYLRAMKPGEEIMAEELGKRVGVSRVQARQQLERAREHGLVTLRRQGKANLYTLAPESTEDEDAWWEETTD